MTSTSILTHLRPSGSCQSQSQTNALIRKTVRQLNYIGVFDTPTMHAVIKRRIEALAATEMREAA
mgnify:CR=1 FL=1